MRRLVTSGLHDKSPGEWRVHPGHREWKHVTAGFRSVTGRRILPVLILLICMISLLHRMRDHASISALQADWELIASRVLHKRTGHHHASTVESEVSVPKLWFNGHSTGWRASSATRSSHWFPPRGSNGYLMVRCNGGLNQQRTAICNAVLAARIMNATLVLPQLDTNSFWHDESGFPGIYDVEHFIDSLKQDVRVIKTLPATWAIGSKRAKLKPFQLQPPRDASVSWYETTALEKMKKHGAVYLTPFSHRLDENLDNHEYQRLRCRVNYHALRFNNDIRNLSSIIVQRLRSDGPYMAIHLRFELDMLAFAGCWDVFTPEEQEVLKKYRKENFAEKKLEYNHRRLIGKCPLTPHEVGLFLQAMGFDNSTRIYLAVGEIFGGERFLKPLRDLFPNLDTRSTLAMPEELALVSADGHGLLGPAVDYTVCLLSDIFVPTYDGPSNFANNLIGQRLYYGFRTTLQPDRKALAPQFINLEEGKITQSDFEDSVRQIMSSKSFGRPHSRVSPESFYTNPWPECFCKTSSKEGAHQCPLDIVETTSVDIDEDENFVDEWNQLQRL